MELLSWLLLAVLFIAGLLNFLFYPATGKLYSSLSRRFVPIQQSAVAASASSTTTALERVGTGAARSDEGLKRVFAAFDKNGDGFLTKQEIGESLDNIGISMTDKDVEEMFEKVDANGDGLVDIGEFCELLDSSMARGGARAAAGEGAEEEDVGAADLREAFDVFDCDGDGLISVEELGRVLASFGLNEGRKAECCREMIRKVDLDGDGMVNFDEFRRMMRAGGKIVSAY